MTEESPTLQPGMMELITKSCSTFTFNSLAVKYQPISYVIDVGKSRKKGIKKRLKNINISQADEKDKWKRMSELLELNMPHVVGLNFETAVTSINRPFNLNCYDGDLIDYLRLQETNWTHFQWADHEGLTHQQCIFIQLIKTIAFLHDNGKFFDGEIHPRNVFFTQSSNQKTKIIVDISEKLNPFREVDKFYKNYSKVSLDCPIKQDMVALAGLIYFILSCGRNLFVNYKPDTEMQKINYDNIYEGCTLEKTRSSKWHTAALNQLNCICTTPGSCGTNAFTLICKFRQWINRLAVDWINRVLNEILKKNRSPEENYYTKNLDNIRNHPLFWRVSDSLGFLQRSSNFLTDSSSSKIHGFQKINLVENSHYPSVKPNSILFKHFPSLLMLLQDKYGKVCWISSCDSLFKQIRNKSIHWNDQRIINLRKAAEKELEKMQFVFHNQELDVFPIKYCLFWMCHFPFLLLKLWTELKDYVK